MKKRNFAELKELDETTKDLPNRSNKKLLKKYSNFEEEKENENSINEENENTKVVKNIGFKEFNSWINNNSFINTFNLEELRFFDELHELLSLQESMKGISFRVLQGIANYINNIPNNDDEEPLISRDEAFDICVNQRILTKIKGSDRELDGLINSEYINEDDIGKLYSFFSSKQAKNLSEFSNVKLKIKQKFEELRKYGYTS